MSQDLGDILLDVVLRLRTIQKRRELSAFARQHRLVEPWCRKVASGQIVNPGILKVEELRLALDAWDVDTQTNSGIVEQCEEVITP